jgi:hypothetical protein
MMHPVMCEVNYCLVCREYIVCFCKLRNVATGDEKAIRNVKVMMPVSELESIIAAGSSPALTAAIDQANVHENQLIGSMTLQKG